MTGKTNISRMFFGLLALTLGTGVQAQEVDLPTLTGDFVFALQNQEERCVIPANFVTRWQTVAAAQIERGAYSDNQRIDVAEANAIMEGWWAGLEEDGLLVADDSGAIQLTDCPPLSEEEAAQRGVERALARLAAMSGRDAMAILEDAMSVEDCGVSLSDEEAFLTRAVAHAAMGLGVEMPDPMPSDDVMYAPLVEQISEVVEFAAEQAFASGSLIIENGVAVLATCTPNAGESAQSSD